jgi:hypothetical protein
MLSTSEIERLLRNQKETQDFAAKLFLRSNIRESYSTLHENMAWHPRGGECVRYVVLCDLAFLGTVLCRLTTLPTSISAPRRYSTAAASCL